MTQLSESLRVSSTVKDRLDEIKTRQEHSSYDSAIRELLTVYDQHDNE